MKNLVWCLPVGAFLLFGCHKNTSSGQAPAASGSNAVAGEPGAEPAEPLAPPPAHVVARAENAVHEAVVGEVNAFLTEQLRAFVQQKGRLPRTFGEFASARLDSIPRPPEGRKWAIDTANLEVKAVSAQ